MSLLNIECIYPPNFGWIEARLTADIIQKLDGLLEKAKDAGKQANRTLAGNISESLEMDDPGWIYSFVVKPLIDEYVGAFGALPILTVSKITPDNEMPDMTLSRLWVNHQEQTEFNPMHHHSGIFSFVIFYEIPTHWAEQHALPHAAKSNQPQASDFQFVYSDILGATRGYNIKMSPESNGMILLFPAALNHTVYPFYNCDKTRITIAGNVYEK
jgi:hypothetical protein